MPVNLAALVKADKGEDVRWFNFKEDQDGIFQRTTEDNPDFALSLNYRSKRAMRRMVEGAATRKPASKHGIKTMLSTEEQFRELLCNAVVRDWKMTVGAAKQLLAEMEFKDLPDTEIIDFTPENLASMTRYSLLPVIVANTMAEHEAWFGSGKPAEEDDEDEGDEKNSVGGPSSTSAGPPAATASPTP